METTLLRGVAAMEFSCAVCFFVSMLAVSEGLTPGVDDLRSMVSLLAVVEGIFDDGAWGSSVVSSDRE